MLQTWCFSSEKKQRWAIVCTAWLLSTVYYFGGFDGYYGYDDATYAHYAKQVADGSFVTNDDHFSFRWGIIYPTGWAIRCLGMNDNTLCLVVLLALWSSIGAVAVAFRRLPIPYLAAASIFFVLDYYTLYYSHKLFADTLVAALGLWIVVMTAEVRFRTPSRMVQIGAGSIAALLLWAALLSKETIYFITPFLAYLFFSDLYVRQRTAYWASFAIHGSIGLVAYLAYMYFTFGDPIYRISLTEASSYFNSCSYHLLPWSHVLSRISYGLLVLLCSNGMAISLWFALIGFGQRYRNDWWKANNERDFYSLACMMLLLCYNFLSISPKYYIPMCLDGRHYLLLIPIAAMASAQSWIDFCATGKNRWQVLLLLLGMMLLTHYGGFTLQQYIYVMLFCWVLGRIALPWLWEKKRFFRFVYAALFTAILLIHPLYVVWRPAYNGQQAARQLVQQYLPPRNTIQYIVITDDIQQAVSELHTQYDSIHYKFVEYRNVSTKLFPTTTNMYLLLNRYSNEKVRTHHRLTIPDYVEQIPPDFRLVAQIDNVELYTIPADYFRCPSP